MTILGGIDSETGCFIDPVFSLQNPGCYGDKHAYQSGRFIVV
jgi:hypothetical protein